MTRWLTYASSDGTDRVGFVDGGRIHHRIVRGRPAPPLSSGH